jgi:hypothetical protein
MTTTLGRHCPSSSLYMTLSQQKTNCHNCYFYERWGMCTNRRPVIGVNTAFHLHKGLLWLVQTWGNCCDWCRHPCLSFLWLYKQAAQLILWAAGRYLPCFLHPSCYNIGVQKDFQVSLPTFAKLVTWRKRKAAAVAGRKLPQQQGSSKASKLSSPGPGKTDQGNTGMQKLAVENTTSNTESKFDGSWVLNFVMPP